ncbi:signal recognition particle protein [Candidatus Neptunochlamydia vexilliferae]|uniref:Signal recognition particle protein n=1 Tax=Candidatus Neptunichlamydia vexilliferae TaxID=1651774 RepID=A0ABS0B1R4_9BACT|nr:signal recognition particle protein [Candidatus Neptunochlamydia vexilliferae]MBF5059500.1 Signal recognition particle protein [Candidatus Neptunochlamydia vexilliferae]
MFGGITEKFQNVFSALASKKTLTDENISDAVREVRLALLDADVNYTVAKNFIKRVKEKALGEETIKSVKAGDQFTKIIHDELKNLMGGKEPSLSIGHRPSVILMCGLQGSGKTTQSAKLALYLKKQNKKVLIAACDLQRPAAIDQLETLGKQVEVPIYADRDQKKPVKVAKKALEQANKEGIDVLIIDTAGRLHIDEELMKELEKIKGAVNPHEVLFVANAATGQDAVKTAAEFDQRMSITGSILTMLDGNTRAGAAISICEVTGKPLKFEGIGEKVTDFQLFNPQSMADRILGMGDVINLVKKAQEHVNEEDAEKLKKKLLKASFTFDDFLKQMRSVKKMGSLKGLLSMIPGFSANMGDLEMSDKELGKIEAIILSMTPNERLGLDELVPSRRRRIAGGSGTTIDDVNKMIKNFKRVKQMMKKMPGMKKKFLNDSNFKDQLSSLKGSLGNIR